MFPKRIGSLKSVVVVVNSLVQRGHCLVGLSSINFLSGILCRCSDDLVRWSEWTRVITGLSDMKVPRCVKPKHLRKVDSIQLHYFSDASEEGYGVVSYLRIVDSHGNIATGRFNHIIYLR